MARSLWKGPFVDTYLLKNSNKILNNTGPGKIQSAIENVVLEKNSNLLKGKGSGGPSALYKTQSGTKSNPIRVWSRRSFILPEFIDQFYEIYNGKQFISFQVNEDMVGHKFGEFASTRKKTLHKKVQKSK